MSDIYLFSRNRFDKVSSDVCLETMDNFYDGDGETQLQINIWCLTETNLTELNARDH